MVIIIAVINFYSSEAFPFDDKSECTLKGRVYHKEIKNDQYVYYLKDAVITAQSGSFNNCGVYLILDSDNIPNTSTIKLSGKIYLFNNARNEGNFDEAKYYNSLGLCCKIKNARVMNYSVNKLFAHDYLYKARKLIAKVYEYNLPGEEHAIMSSIAIGDKSDMDAETKKIFALAGIIHILAISGLHISFIGSFVFKMLRKCGLGFGISVTISSGFIIAYTIMAGASISAVRALVMYIIYMLAQLTGESYDTLTGLAISAVCLVISNPAVIFNTGFIFSFSAVLGVNVIANPLVKQYEQELSKAKNINKKKTILFKSLYTSFGITLFTLPIVAYSYFQIPLYSVILNLLLLPLVPFMLGSGLIGGLIGCISKEMGQIMLKPAHILIYILEMVADKSSHLPGATIITGRPSIALIVGYEIILFIIIQNKRPIKTKYRAIMSIILVGVFVLIGQGHSRFEIDVLDVGQGDGTFVLSKEGTTFFIDGGSSNVSGVGQYRIEPFLKARGVTNIDYWFITHSDDDHISGLMEILGEYKVKNIVFSDKVVTTDNYRRLIELAENSGTKVCYMKQGDSCGDKSIRFTCIYPLSDSMSDDPNSMSLTLYMKEVGGFSGLFTGDIGKAEETAIIAEYPGLKVDYLKVAHHGSKYSSDEEFISKISPKIATISCSKNNTYGHPSREVITTLEKNGIKIYYTKDNGQLSIDKYARVKTYIK